MVEHQIQYLFSKILKLGIILNLRIICTQIHTQKSESKINSSIYCKRRKFGKAKD